MWQQLHQQLNNARSYRADKIKLIRGQGGPPSGEILLMGFLNPKTHAIYATVCDISASDKLSADIDRF